MMLSMILFVLTVFLMHVTKAMIPSNAAGMGKFAKIRPSSTSFKIHPLRCTWSPGTAVGGGYVNPNEGKQNIEEKSEGGSLADSVESMANSTPTSTSSELGLRQKLSAAGRGGLLAYGFLNALYYCTVTFVTFCIYIKDDMLSIPASLSMRARVVKASAQVQDR